MSRWLLVAAVAVGCSKNKDQSGDSTTPGPDGSDTPTVTDYTTTHVTDYYSDSTTDGGTTGPCTNSVNETFPVDGAVDAFYRTNVEFLLATAEPGASIEVVDDATGAAVAGTTAVDDIRVVWTPTDPLDPSTSYTATLDWSCPNVDSSFTTTETGAPIADPTDLIDNAYRIAIANGRWVQPPGVGAIISSMVTTDLLLGVVDADATTIQVRGAFSDATDPNQQDLCSESMEFPTAADFTQNPFFSVGPEDTTLSITGVDLTVDGLYISGAFSPNGDEIQGGVFSGEMDTRPLVDLIYPGGGPDAVCQLVATFGINCLACPDGTGNFCLALEIEDLDAPYVPGLNLIKVTPSQAQANADAGTCTN